jgi:predicted GNAT family acetyltransferase
MTEALDLNEQGHGHFYILDGEVKAGEMKVSISPTHLTAYHTEVPSIYEGKGLAKKLFASMVEYARSNNLKVIPLCPFVLIQFRRHRDEYEDIWEKKY